MGNADILGTFTNFVMGVLGMLAFMFIGSTLFALFMRWNLGNLKKASQRAGIAIVAIEGVLSFGNNKGFRKIMASLGQVSNLSPKALIVKINSPGGTVASSQELYLSLRDLKEKGIKIVALMQDTAASGGLYAALPADRIIAYPGTITGSIGVIIQGYEFPKLLKKIGVGVRTIKSGAHKDILSPFKEMSEAEKALLQGTVMDVYEQFVGAVAEARGLEIETVKSFADGRILTGAQAKNLGLVDELGGFQTALKAARELAEIEEGEEQILPLGMGGGFLERFGMGQALSRILAKAESVLPDTELSGPLWLMPRF